MLTVLISTVRWNFHQEAKWNMASHCNKINLDAFEKWKGFYYHSVTVPNNWWLSWKLKQPSAVHEHESTIRWHLVSTRAKNKFLLYIATNRCPLVIFGFFLSKTHINISEIKWKLSYVCQNMYMNGLLVWQWKWQPHKARLVFKRDTCPMLNFISRFNIILQNKPTLYACINPLVRYNVINVIWKF